MPTCPLLPPHAVRSLSLPGELLRSDASSSRKPSLIQCPTTCITTLHYLVISAACRPQGSSDPSTQSRQAGAQEAGGGRWVDEGVSEGLGRGMTSPSQGKTPAGPPPLHRVFLDPLPPRGSLPVGAGCWDVGVPGGQCAGAGAGCGVLGEGVLGCRNQYRPRAEPTHILGPDTVARLPGCPAAPPRDRRGARGCATVARLSVQEGGHPCGPAPLPVASHLFCSQAS